MAVDIVVEFDGRSIPLPYAKGGWKEWVGLPPAKDVVISFSFERLNRFPQDMKVHAPRFPKVRFGTRTMPEIVNW